MLTTDDRRHIRKRRRTTKHIADDIRHIGTKVSWEWTHNASVIVYSSSDILSLSLHVLRLVKITLFIEIDYHIF